MKSDSRKVYQAVLWLIILFLGAVSGVCLILGQDMRIAVPDNLDLFQAQYQMLKNEALFDAQGAASPFLHGVTRDDLPSELTLPGVLYRLLPSFYAYGALYILRVLLAAGSFLLLFRELDARGWLGGADRRCKASALSREATEDSSYVESLALLAGFAYGILNLFPAFGISFASLPLIVFLLLKLDREESLRKRALLYAGIFCYPFVSYFSYFGLFILAYMALGWIITSVRRRRLHHRLFISILLLSAGFMVFEYRLFRSMLFSHEVTIRTTMVVPDLTFTEILPMMRSVLTDGGAMHTQSVQQYVVMPVCVIYLILLNARIILSHFPLVRDKIQRQPWRRLYSDLYNQGVFLLLLNALIYGLYYSGPFRHLVETLVPPLTGWQFGRTSFLNPFLWYALFCVAMVRLLKRGSRFVPFALSFACCAVILLTDTDYNDLYHTAHAEANRILRGVQEDSLTYREFYSESLFSEVKDAIGYEGEWCAAYGFHPATLEYNGIRTIDGYLGFYSQDYKDAFREIIAPALDKQPPTKAYYDDWGARCYLYSGNHSTIVEAVRNYPHPEDTADLNTDAMRALDCKYIFSRPQITNAGDLGLTLLGHWTNDASPYDVYVYAIP